MRIIFIVFLFFNFLFGINFSDKEKQFLKDNPVIYISSMMYWPLDHNGESIHTNYMKLLNKYGHLNLQPVYYKYWSDGFNDAKDGITYGIMALSYSKNREKYFYYTKPYNYTPYYLIVNKDSDINSFDDLKNKKVFIAKNSILREVLKNTPFNIVYTKTPYKALANKNIDAILLFYMPKTKYIEEFKVIKTFIDKAGEEHIGISKKYPELYSIIKKVMDIIPFEEIEKIRGVAYETKISTGTILTPKLKLKDLITKEDVIFIVILVVGLGTVLFLFLTRQFLNLSIKKFLISIFIFDGIILGFLVYEVFVFNYYSNKILEIKSKSFNSLYLVDKIENRIQNLNNTFERKYLKNKGDIKKCFINGYPIFENLIVENQPLKNLLNAKNFTLTELSHLAYIQKLFNNLINIQKKVLEHKLNYSIYKQSYIYLIKELDMLKDTISNENKKEIYIIKQKLKYQFILLVISVMLFILESIFVFIMIKKKVYNPIRYLIDVIQKYKDGVFIKREYKYEDEFGELINEFFSLQDKLNQKIEELNQHKQNLQLQVKEEVEKRVYQEKILIKQSKMALMGEMIDAIAHQWKQPLNTISLGIQLLELEKDNIKSKDIEEFAKNMDMQIEHMISTLDEFRSFFRDTKEKEVICMNKVVKKVLLLLKDDLVKNNITIETKIDKDFCIQGIENEFQHLLITLLTNAKDIFKERNIKDRKIIIQTKNDDIYYYLEVIDNAGGIPEGIKDKIFELNFTTREDGSGVGLYLASQIAIKHMGSLEVENIENGAKFYFKVRGDV